MAASSASKSSDSRKATSGQTDRESKNREEGRKRRGFDVDRSLHTTADAGMELVGDLANAVAQGARTCRDHMERDDMTRLGLNNGLVRGLFEGTMKTLEEVPGALRRSYDHLTEESDDAK